MAKKMTKREMSEFKALLLQKRGLLTGNVTSLGSGVGKGGGGDSADQGLDSYEQEFSLSLIENEVDVVQKIDEALERIEGGKFGECLECETPIVKPRLRAIPWASLCVDCQRQQESF